MLEYLIRLRVINLACQYILNSLNANIEIIFMLPFLYFIINFFHKLFRIYWPNISISAMLHILDLTTVQVIYINCLDWQLLVKDWFIRNWIYFKLLIVIFENLFGWVYLIELFDIVSIKRNVAVLTGYQKS